MALTKQQQDEIILLKASGWTYAAISEETGHTVSVIRKLLAKAHPVRKGELKEAAIEAARQKLMQDAGLMKTVKEKIASAIVDDMALASALRLQISLTLEQLASDTTGHFSSKARALAALSTSLSVTQQAIRKALNIDQASLSEQAELPTLTIYKMSDDDVKALRELQENPDL